MDSTEAIFVSHSRSYAIRLALAISEPLFTLLHQFIQKIIKLLYGDIRHHHHMSNVSFACQLPPVHELLIVRSLEHNGAAQLVQHCSNACIHKPTFEVVCIAQTLLHLFLKPSVPFHV